MKTQDCLVVVDMQYGFRYANDRRTIDNVCALIKAYKAENKPIYGLRHQTLMYDGEDMAVVQEVMDAIGPYEHYREADKEYDDGGGEVVGMIGHLGIESIEVCGVNTQYCVRATALELKDEYGFYVVVNMDAVNGPCNEWGDHEDAEDMFEWYDIDMCNLPKGMLV
jgi:nicotinamidase-related amidase